jgi:hypothetical protein
MKANGALQTEYDGPTYQVSSDIFAGIVGKRIQEPSQLYKRYKYP